MGMKSIICLYLLYIDAINDWVWYEFSSISFICHVLQQCHVFQCGGERSAQSPKLFEPYCQALKTTLSGFESPLFQQFYNFPIKNNFKKMWENLTCSSFEGELYNAVPPTNITMDFKRWGVRAGSLSNFVSCGPNVHLSLISPTSNSFLSIE